MYDIEKIRLDFPNLALKVNGKPNTFLDTAASAQKPQEVIDKIQQDKFEKAIGLKEYTVAEWKKILCMSNM